MTVWLGDEAGADVPVRSGEGRAADLSRVLAALTVDGGGDKVRLRTILGRLGAVSFPAVLLLIAVMIVSPLSAIPFLPWLFSLVVLLVGIQGLCGRERLWLPEVVLDREFDAARVARAAQWLARPVAWLEAKRSGRWARLADPPLSALSYVLIMVIAVTWAPMSLVPFSATLTAVGMALAAAGLVLRDGVFIVAGFVWTAVIYGAGALFILGIAQAV